MLGWLAFLCVLTSFYFLGKHDRLGWVIGSIGCCIWIIVCIATGNWPLLAQQIALLIYGAYNYTRWKT